MQSHRRIAGSRQQVPKRFLLSSKNTTSISLACRPAVSHQGGEWTSEGGDRPPENSTSDAALSPDDSTGRGPQYAALDARTRTDATDGSGTSAGSNRGVLLAANSVTPHGFTFEEVSAPDPLDPGRLNTPISPEEEQKVSDALNLILDGDFSTLHRHVYRNRPDPDTGATLPSSTSGYEAFDVPELGAGRGVGKLVIDLDTGAIYYTNNHYHSFYPLKLNPRGE